MKKYNLYLLVLNEGVASKYLQTLKDFGFPGEQLSKLKEHPNQN